MELNAPRRWRPVITTGATVTFLLVTAAGCGQAAPQADTSGPCKTLPASDVPPMQKAVTEQNSGTYCVSAGTSILIVLKAKDFTAASAWASPSTDGPSGGTHWLSVPLTALRGTTVAAVEFSVPGTYELTSSAGSARWQVAIRVGH